MWRGVLSPHSGSASLGSSPLLKASSTRSRSPREAASCNSVMASCLSGSFSLISAHQKGGASTNYACVWVNSPNAPHSWHCSPPTNCFKCSPFLCRRIASASNHFYIFWKWVLHFMYTGVQGAGEGRPGSSNRVHGARRIATVEECADVSLALYKLAWDASKQWMQRVTSGVSISDLPCCYA